MRLGSFLFLLAASGLCATHAHANDASLDRPVDAVEDTTTPLDEGVFERDAPLDDVGVTHGPVALDPTWRSVRVLRGGEVVRAAPSATAARRGVLVGGARLPALEASSGPGCTGPWVRVAIDAWVCSDRAPGSNAAPEATEHPVVPTGAEVPYRYATTARARTLVWRRLEDVGTPGAAQVLTRGMVLAMRDTRVLRGERFGETADRRWIALRDLVWNPTAEHRATGRLYPPQVDVSAAPPTPGMFAFAPDGARAWPTALGAIDGRAPVAGAREILRHQSVRVREERIIRGVRLLQTDRGWVNASYLVRPEVPAPPTDLAPNERWVDVDRTRQVMVAFEGRVPVWAALVSTGRAGHATTAGSFRVRVKLADDDMSNVSTVNQANTYFVARVPWVMYFHAGEAFHAAFWHDRFGHPHSHGCVNLAPQDARWLYRWAPPATPAGWVTSFSAPGDPGMRVRVR
jgi:hypothetical protein